MTDHDDSRRSADRPRAAAVRDQLHQLPAPPAHDSIFADIIAAGRTRRKARRGALVAGVAAAIVATTTTVALSVPTRDSGDEPITAGPPVRTSATPSASAPPTAHRPSSPPCRQSDLTADLRGGMLQTLPDALDEYDMRMITSRPCQLAGPLRLQRQDAAGQWRPVPQPRSWRWENIAPGVGSDNQATHQQDSTARELDPSEMYSVKLSWIPDRKRSCAPSEIRLVGPAVTLLLGPLPHWCNEPVEVSNTYGFTRTRSIHWRLVAHVGRTLTVAHQPQCFPVRARATETGDSVTVVLLATDVLGTHGCLPMPVHDVTTTITLRAPLGSRSLRHARVGPWPATLLPPVNR